VRGEEVYESGVSPNSSGHAETAHYHHKDRVNCQVSAEMQRFRGQELKEIDGQCRDEEDKGCESESESPHGELVSRSHGDARGGIGAIEGRMSVPAASGHVGRCLKLLSRCWWCGPNSQASLQLQ